MYENFYRLRAKPFRLSPDPGFFFASRGHKRALAYLRYGLSQSEGFVVITGAPGTGKTTLAQILLQEMDQSDVVVAHLTTTQLEADEMLRMVLASFGLRFEGQDKASLLKTLEAFFMARSREHKRVLLVVDEAQNLPARSLEELRMLSNLQVGDQALCQTFLLGQVQFRQMLDHPDLEQLRQRVIANYHLSALGEDECQDYIESRLLHVGWENDPHFTAEAFEVIHNYTEGVPRRINMLCDRVLLFSSLEEEHEINAAVLRDVTDELQSEISGRPITRPVKVDDLPEATPEPANKEVMDSSAESTAVSERGPGNSTPETIPDESPAPKTVLVEIDDNPAIAAELPDTHLPDNGGLDRVMPDDGWMQHVAQAQPDEIGTQDGVDNNEPAEMERFRVIAGGREGLEGAAKAVERPANHPSPEIRAPLPDAPGDTQEVVLRKILRLVLAFHRSPRSFPGLDDPTQPLPNGITAIMELAIADDHVLSNLRQIAVMGISPSMLRAAVRFFVRRVMFLPGGDDFRVLGLATEASLTDVETHYDLLMKLLRQDNKSGDESGISRVGEAYERLCRSELTARTEDSTDAELGDIDAIADIEEELDLDLSPNTRLRGNPSLRHAPSGAGEVVTGDDRTAPTTRNIMLIAGAAVIVFILYLTQIKTSDETASELAVDQPREPVVTESIVTAQAPVELNTQTPIKAQATAKPLPVIVATENAIAGDVVSSNTMPGENRAQAAIEAEIVAKEKAVAEARAQAEAEATLKLAAEAKLKLEARIKAQAVAEAKAIAKAKAIAEAKAISEARAAAKARAEAQVKAEAAAREKVRAEAETKAAALAKAVAERQAAQAQAAMQSATSTGIVSTQALDKILTGFAAAFQSGDLKKLMSVHSSVVRTDKHIDAAGVRGDYQALFSSSTERSIQFENMGWERKSSYARGSGQYRLKVTGKDDSPTYTETGDITLQLENRSGKLEIIRYYASNAVVTEQAKPVPVSAPPATITSTNASTNQFARIPGKQLDGLLSKLISSYAAGDINAFMQLFAKDAQTNDRATVKGIRGDYVGLFNSTSFRSITFPQLKWRWEGQVARAEGTYNVQVQPNGKNKRDNYQGQVWIQVERREGGVRITHFAFAE